MTTKIEEQTMASISQEIQMREATKNKIMAIECPLLHALREAKDRREYEEKRIIELGAEIKRRRLADKEVASEDDTQAAS